MDGSRERRLMSRASVPAFCRAGRSVLARVLSTAGQVKLCPELLRAEREGVCTGVLVSPLSLCFRFPVRSFLEDLMLRLSVSFLWSLPFLGAPFTSFSLWPLSSCCSCGSALVRVLPPP